MLNFILAKLGAKFRGFFDPMLDKLIFIEYRSHWFLGSCSLYCRGGSLDWGVCAPVHEIFQGVRCYGVSRGSIIFNFHMLICFQN